MDMSKALRGMTLDQLRTHRQEIDVAIAESEGSAKQEMRSRLEQIASQSGFNIDELFASVRRNAKSKGKPAKTGRKWPAPDKLYRNPANPAGKLWTGRGKKPNWLVEQMANDAIAALEIAADLAS